MNFIKIFKNGLIYDWVFILLYLSHGSQQSWRICSYHWRHTHSITSNWHTWQIQGFASPKQNAVCAFTRQCRLTWGKYSIHETQSHFRLSSGSRILPPQRARPTLSKENLMRIQTSLRLKWFKSATSKLDLFTAIKLFHGVILKHLQQFRDS